MPHGSGDIVGGRGPSEGESGSEGEGAGGEGGGAEDDLDGSSALFCSLPINFGISSIGVTSDESIDLVTLVESVTVGCAGLIGGLGGVLLDLGHVELGGDVGEVRLVGDGGPLPVVGTLAEGGDVYVASFLAATDGLGS